MERSFTTHDLGIMVSTRFCYRQPSTFSQRERLAPRQKPKPKLSPGRVAQAMGEVFAAIGTPAQAPKPRGKSPGWPEGQTRTRRIRYPTVKKSTTKPQKPQNPKTP